MKQYIIPFLLIFASCNSLPKKGEIWRNAVPYTMDVQVDSVVDNQLVMYSWDSLTHKLKGDSSGNFMRFVDSIVHEIGVCQMDSFTVRGFKIGEVGPPQIPIHSFWKSASIVNDSGIYITDRVPEYSMQNMLNIEILFTKKQLDSAYRKGVKIGRAEKTMNSVIHVPKHDISMDVKRPHEITCKCPCHDGVAGLFHCFSDCCKWPNQPRIELKNKP